MRESLGIKEPESKPGSYELQDQRGRNRSRPCHRLPKTCQLRITRGIQSLGTQEVVACSCGRERNSTGEQANLDDTNTPGEPNYCSSDPHYFLSEPIMGPNDTFEPPTWFPKEIAIIAASPSLAPTKKSSVRFDVSLLEAAEHNASLL